MAATHIRIAPVFRLAGVADGKVNAEAQVLAGAAIVGAVGNTTALIVLSWQAVNELVAFAAVPPHAAVSLYRALMVQHPEVLVNNAFAAARVP